MTPEEVLRLHTGGFNRALQQQDYATLEENLGTGETYPMSEPMQEANEPRLALGFFGMGAVS
jgi:hypothetical protein